MSFLEKYPRTLLILLTACYLLPGIKQLPLLDRDEPRFSRATVEMMERGNWVVPYFNNEYRFDKPPLTYWWMNLHYRLLGVTEKAARLHSIICVGLIALLTHALALRMKCSQRTALLAAFIWISTLQVWIHGRLALADMPLILGITMTMLGLHGYLFTEPGKSIFNKNFWLVYLGISIGFLAKGPLAYFIPGISLGLFLLLGRKHPVAGRNLNHLGQSAVAGLPLTLLLIGLWGIPALLQTDGAYFEVGIGEHVVERGVQSFNERFFIPGVYYFGAILVFFSPWVSALIPSIKANWKQRETSPAGLLLLCWAASSFLIFSFYKTQLPHYILPGYPALAIMAASFLSEGHLRSFQISHWINRIVLLIVVILCITIASILWPIDHVRSLPLALLSLAWISLMLLTASELIFRKRTKWSILAISLSAIGFTPFAHHIRNSHITVALEDQLGQAELSSGNAYGIGFSEPSLIWYTNRYWNFKGSKELDQIEMAADDVLVFGARRWRLDEDMIFNWIRRKPVQALHDRRSEMIDRFPSHDIQWVSGFNPGNSSWIELALVREKESK